MQRVSAYCRVSTDKADQAHSFRAQQSFFREYIGRQPEWELVSIYADEGRSGTSVEKRGEFARMLRDAGEHAFDLLLTKEVSRFSRNILDTIYYTRALKALGIGVLFLSDAIDTRQPDAELRLSIMGSLAQEESRKISDRVKWGQTRQMEHGVVFGRSLLGYDVINGALVPNEEGAVLVRRIFREYALEKKGSSEIAGELQREGCRTSRGGEVWRASHIVKILRNEKYAGDLVQKKTYTPDYLTHRKKTNHGEEEKIVLTDHHVPIIERSLWECAQSELAKRNKHKK